MKPKSILQNLFAMLVVLCFALEINAQTPDFEKIKAEADSFAQRFSHWCLDSKSMSNNMVFPMLKSVVADIELFRPNDLGFMWYDAKYLHDVDTTYSAPESNYFIINYERMNFGASYPTFQFSHDSINIDVKIGYKNIWGCRDISLIFNVIDNGATTIKTDSIHLPLSNEWTEQTYSLTLPRGNLLMTALNVAVRDSTRAFISLAPIKVSADGHPLTWDFDADKYAQIPAFAIQPFDDLLASPLMDKKILALGETIHGSQNINDLVFSLIKERILHHNCRLVMLEFPTEAVLYMNRYVKNDARFSLDTISKFYEAKALFKITPFLKWLHDYNAAHNNEVTLIGADTFLSKYETFQSLFDFLTPLNSDYALDSLCYELLLATDTINFDCNKSVVNQRLTADEVELFRHCLDAYQHRPSLYFPYSSRDSLMANRIQRFCDAYLGENETATFYSHFSHSNYISLEPHISINTPSVGKYLKKRYKDDYSCLAISAAQGERYASLPVVGNAQIASLDPAPVGSFEYLMNSRTDDKPIFISTNNLKQGDIYQLRFSGAHINNFQFFHVEPQAFMDGIIIVKNSTPVENVYNEGQESQRKVLERRFSNIHEISERLNGGKRQ